MPATLYDQVSYPTQAHAQTHPDRLATMATLFGMKPAPVENCRVLEIGCGNGWNLIPMAYGLPNSEFLGIDLAADPIAHGNEAIQALHLPNIRLAAQDLMEFDGHGQFDYIITHGLYAWVPEPVRDRILAVTKAHLAPQGVGFISYNANPGGRIRQLVREMMLFHSGGISDPNQKVQQGIAFLDFLANCRTDQDPWLALARAELEKLTERVPGVVIHDEFSDVYEPVYFNEFVGHAGRHGLQYVSEAIFPEMHAGSLPAATQQRLRELSGGDFLAYEQYLDFAKFRKFRQTLLCHAGVALERVPKPESFRALHVSSPVYRIDPEPGAAPDVERFQGFGGASASTNNPMIKSVLGKLIDVFPLSASFQDLLAFADESTLADLLLKLYGARLAEFHSHRPPIAAAPGERPKASAVARYQAGIGKYVTTLRHGHVLIDDAVSRGLLQLLDGTHNRADLVAALKSAGVSAENINSQLDASLKHLTMLALFLDESRTC